MACEGQTDRLVGRFGDVDQGGAPPARGWSVSSCIVGSGTAEKEGRQTGEEGCLSIPGFRAPVTRPNKATVRARNVQGDEIEISGEALLARAMLHEIDHLNGILFLSHLSMLKRDVIKRKIKKLQKAGEWE